MKTDILIIGAGPAGIVTAIELRRRGRTKKITVVEKGKAVEERRCPKEQTQKCVNCKPNCNITTGFSGAGAFSDGKLSLSCEVGGELPSLIGEAQAQALIDYTDAIYLDFGADTRVEGAEETEEVKDIRRRAISAGLKLVLCPIRHLGTEKAQQLYLDIENWLRAQDVELLLETECRNLIIENDVCLGAEIVTSGREETILADEVVVATGRRGTEWLEELCVRHGIAHSPGPVDIGVRVEVRNEVKIGRAV